MSSSNSHSSTRSLALAGLVVILAVFTAGAVAACGGDDQGTASSPAATDKFAGNWAPVDARLEITWGNSKSYGISLADGSFGGLVVEKSADAYSVKVVGVDGTTTEPLPATADGDVLSFAIPIMEISPTELTLTVSADGTAKVRFGDDSTPWDFKKADTLATESK